PPLNLNQDFFEISVSYREELAFEEEFRYLIATSSLLNDSMNLSAHNRKASVVSMADDERTPSLKRARIAGMSLAVIASATLCAFTVHKGFVDLQLHRLPSRPLIVVPGVTAVLGLAGVSCFSFYKQMRRNAIRRTHAIALKILHNFVHQSQLLDSKINKTLIMIQEIELVSRGYRLSTPLSPISRIEQSSKSRRCLHLRRTLATLLRTGFATYDLAISHLQPQIDRANLQKLYGMYNIHPIAASSVEETNTAASDREDEESDYTALEHLRRLAQLMHWKRRECLTQLMALEVMTEGHDSVRFDYERRWREVNAELRKLVESTREMVNQVAEALDVELYNPPPDKPDSATPKTSDKRLQAFLHRVTSLEQHTRGVQAKLYLTSEDARALSDGPISQEIKDKLTNQFASIAQDFTYMLAEWEDGRSALQHFFDPPPPANSDPTVPNELPSPPASPARRLIVLDHDPSESFLLPAPARAQLFEAVAGQDDEQAEGASGKRLSRAERITRMKEKREDEAKATTAKMDSQKMVHELKDVLGKRRAGLDDEGST
ncbi:Mysoin-binding motif of peroxisomes-domain-containing protein, partial [Jimgerdemannia flammicorona]